MGVRGMGEVNCLGSGFWASRRAAAVDFMRRWRPNTPRGCEGAAYVTVAYMEFGATTTRKVGLFLFSHPLLTQAFAQLFSFSVAG